VSYDDRNKDELKEELRERDLPVSGTKDELIERLEQDDQGRDEGSGDDGDDGDDDSPERAGDEGDRSEDPGHDGERGEDSGQDAGTDRGDGGRRRGLRPKQVVQRAVRHLAELSGRKVEGVAGFERIGDGWRVHLETVEVHRVPPTTDVLGTYEVEVDEDGELLSYSRVRRYIRGAASGEDDG
jgi:hypothetical protein